MRYLYSCFLSVIAMAINPAGISTASVSSAGQTPQQATSFSELSAQVDFQRPEPMVSQSFLGLSIEWGLVDRMLEHRHGRQAAMIRLLGMLSRYNGPPLLRFGGDSQDEAAYDLPHAGDLPKFVHINISDHTLQLLREVSEATGCKLVIGLNLGANRPDLAVRLVRACRRIIGDQHIAAYEIGNEPDFFQHIGGIWQHNNFELYLERWTRYYEAIQPYLADGKQIEGPAFGGGWLREVPKFIRMEHGRLGIVSLHRYPLGATEENSKSPVFCSIANLLKNNSAAGYAQAVAPAVAAAKTYGIPVRYGEMNSAWSGGKKGVSDTTASALWGVDTFFEIAHAGGAGVNLHNSQGFDRFPGNYDPVCFGPHQELHIRPLFYGMLLFARAIQDHARLVPVAYHTDLNIKIWAARAADGTLRVVIINKQNVKTALVRVNFPAGATVRTYRLTAPEVTAVQGLKLDGMTLGTEGSLIGTPSGKVFIWQTNMKLTCEPYSITVAVVKRPM